VNPSRSYSRAVRLSPTLSSGGLLITGCPPSAIRGGPRGCFHLIWRQSWQLQLYLRRAGTCHFGVLSRTGLLFLIRLAPSISMSRMTLASGCVGSRLAVLSLLSPPSGRSDLVLRRSVPDYQHQYHNANFGLTHQG
jgi:hypothetical protein